MEYYENTDQTFRGGSNPTRNISVEAQIDDCSKKTHEKLSFLEKQNEILTQKLNERFQEIAILTQLIEVKDNEINEKIKQQEKIKESLSWRITSPFRFMTKSCRVLDKKNKSIKNKIKIISQSGMFDDVWYCGQYSDVATSDVCPIEHYVTYGYIEKLSPGPGFDSNWYLDNNPDVAKSGQDPLMHYIVFGKNEGRAIKKNGNG